MKKVLVITNESRSYSGIILANTLKGIDRDFNYVTNLVEMVKKCSQYAVQEVHYKDLTMDMVNEYKPDYIVAGGHCSLDGWCEGKNAELRKEYAVEMELIRTTTVPYLGICAGHQYVLSAYGHTDILPMGSDYNEHEECGPVDVTICEEDPIFLGVTNPFCVMAYHSWEIKELPEEFKVIGTTRLCKFAMVKHKTRPVYGTQFHPEMLACAQVQGGAQLLKNFFVL